MRYSIQKATLEQVKAVGGSDIKETKAIGIIFAELSNEQANRLKAQGALLSIVSGVKAVVFPPVISPPTPVAAVPTYTASDLITITGLDKLRDITVPPLYGLGMTLAIIGTGIRETHQQIKGRVVYRKNYTADVMQDGFNHDTGTASIALVLAPQCNILNLKVLDNKGEGTEEEVVIAIDDCISMWNAHSQYAPNVMNLSLGGPDDGNPNNTLRVACRAAIATGIWVFASAGNFGPTPYSITCPACEQYVFGIGSVKYLPDQKSFIISSFSSRGPTLEGLIKPDAVLFGEDISMASSDSDTATIAKSGTSFAAPFGAAMGILYLEGVNKLAQTQVQLGQLPPAQLYYVSPNKVIDEYFPKVCIKPAGVVAGKDDEYGWGVAYGPYILQAFQPAAAMDISTMLSGITPIFGIAMLGMIIKTMIPEHHSNNMSAELESNWWSKYSFKDIPEELKNPHFKSVFDQSPKDKQAIAMMAVGAYREQNDTKKAAKYQYLKEQMESYGVFINVTPQQFLSGEMKYLQIIGAAIMEIFTPSGLYSKR